MYYNECAAVCSDGLRVFRSKMADFANRFKWLPSHQEKTHSVNAGYVSVCDYRLHISGHVYYACLRFCTCYLAHFYPLFKDLQPSFDLHPLPLLFPSHQFKCLLGFSQRKTALVPDRPSKTMHVKNRLWSSRRQLK